MNTFKVLTFSSRFSRLRGQGGVNPGKLGLISLCILHRIIPSEPLRYSGLKNYSDANEILNQECANTEGEGVILVTSRSDRY